MEDKGLWTVKDTAKYLNVSDKTIYNMVREGRLPFVRVGGQYRFNRVEIDHYFRQTVGTEPPWRRLVGRAQSTLEKRLLFLGLLTKELERTGIKPILVGGNAVEFYTAGGYATADIDLVAPFAPIDKILRSWGFIKEGRFWYEDKAGIALEIPDSVLAGDPDRVLAVEIDDTTCYIIGIEDILADRLNAAVHWSSQEDRFWAKELLRTHFDMVDWKYLNGRCRQDGTLDLLDLLKRGLEEDAPD